MRRYLERLMRFLFRVGDGPRYHGTTPELEYEREKGKGNKAGYG